MKPGRPFSVCRLAWYGVWCFLAIVPAVQAAEFTIGADRDIWEYPFATSGTRTTASTFGAVGDTQFDNRDGQFFSSFNTSAQVPINLDTTSYQILSVKLTLTLATGSVVYDPTYDPVATFNGDGTPTAGDDPGRPMELYGVGFRHGVTSGSVRENTPFTPDGDTAPGGRSLYPTDFLTGASINGNNRDVSNNVASDVSPIFDPQPFSIGQVAAEDVDGNGKIGTLTSVTFTLDLANADVLRYLQLSLREGRVSFLATSLFKTENGGGSGGFPVYYTKEFDPELVPILDMVVQTVPEPSAVTMLLCGLGVFAALYRGSRLH